MRHIEDAVPHVINEADFVWGRLAEIMVDRGREIFTRDPMDPRSKYFFFCLTKIFDHSRFTCPSCGSSRSHVLQRKCVVTALHRCDSCSLMFRTPITTNHENHAFYQSEYTQGFTTDVPTDSELRNLLETKFAGSEKDYANYIALLTALGAGPGQRLLDFGCSWGYGSWQLMQAGYQVVSFEISKPRCRFAQYKLGVSAFDDIESVGGDGTYDIFFSAHVLEHVPSVSAAIAIARRKLKPGGLFVGFTPNGSAEFRAKSPNAWKKLWGRVHPNFLDDVYYKKAFPGCLLASSPYDIPAIQDAAKVAGAKTLNLDGVELMVGVRL